MLTLPFFNCGFVPASTKPKRRNQHGYPGVAPPISIPEIDKAINKYERKKEARFEDVDYILEEKLLPSPDEIAAKSALKEILHANRGKLSVNEQGVEEKLLRRKVDTGEGDED